MPRSSSPIFSNKSQALIIVIAFLAMFFIIGIAFFMLAQQEQLAAVKHADAVRARYIAEAGIVYAREILQADKRANVIDSLDDVSFTQFSGERWFEIKDQAGAVFGRFSVEVFDEAGKLHVNACSRDALARLLSECGVDAAKADEIISSRPYQAVEELAKTLSKDDVKRVLPYLTVYSKDREFDLKKNRRPYLNSANPQLILDVFLARGIENATQKAALLVDAGDSDVGQTVFAESLLNRVVPTGMSDQGGWEIQDGVYVAAAGSRQGTFYWSNLGVEDGQYDCFVYGSETGDTVGIIDGQLTASGGKLSKEVTVVQGAFQLAVEPADGTECRFAYVRLVYQGVASGMTRREAAGSEAVAINEIMVAPSEVFDASLTLGKNQRGEVNFNVTHLAEGSYHVMVLSGSPGGYVGDVTVQGRTGKDMTGGEYLSSCVDIGSSGILSVSVVNNDPVKQAVFGGLRLSRQPDGEFVELINVSPDPVDIGLFSIEVTTPAGEFVKGWPATIPQGTVVQSYQHAVIAVDNDDSSEAPAKLKGNGVSFRKIWGFNGEHPDFGAYEGVIDRTFDLFPDDGGIVVLKNRSGRVVDSIEYASANVFPFTSIERSDPASRTDTDNDGLMDGWYMSAAPEKATPGMTNENLGMYTKEGGSVKHDPSEIQLFNRPFVNLGEVSQISSGKEWEKFNPRDLGLVCDSFAYSARSIWFSGEEGRAVPLAAQNEASWEFSGIPAGIYWVTVEGDEAAGCAVDAVVTTQESGQSALPLQFLENTLHYGMIEIPGEEKGSIYVTLVNQSHNILTLKKIILEPVMWTLGRINVNTASSSVLKSVLNDGALVQGILAARPIGNKDGSLLGIGDLILSNPSFLAVHDLLTVRSDVYELKSRGESLINSKPSATDQIRIIYDRG